MRQQSSFVYAWTAAIFGQAIALCDRLVLSLTEMPIFAPVDQLSDSDGLEDDQSNKKATLGECLIL